MGLAVKTAIAAFASVNIIAATGTYQTAVDAHSFPYIDDITAREIIARKPLDNLARFVLGDQGEHYTMYNGKVSAEDDSVDAAFTRAIGNVLNFRNAARPEERFLGVKIAGLSSMALTYPGSFIGGVIGNALYAE